MTRPGVQVGDRPKDLSSKLRRLRDPTFLEAVVQAGFELTAPSALLAGAPKLAQSA